MHEIYDLTDVVEYIANLSGKDSTFVLWVDLRPVGPVEVAGTFPTRAVGLMGRSAFEGALLIIPAHSVHTFGMRFPIDVAFCDRDLTVIEVVTMGRYRLCRPRLKAHSVLEAEAGAFTKWQLEAGSRLMLVT